MPSPLQKRKLIAEINVVPYIDVMLVLLIIFMVTAPLLTQGVKVELPQAGAEPIDDVPNHPPLILSVEAPPRAPATLAPPLGSAPQPRKDGGRASTLLRERSR